MIRQALVTAAAHAVAQLVSLRRELVCIPLEERECEAAGVPYGTATKAVTVTESGPWWHCRVYLDHQPAQEGCVDIRALGLRAEVYYLRKAKMNYRTAL